MLGEWLQYFPEFCDVWQLVVLPPVFVDVSVRHQVVDVDVDHAARNQKLQLVWEEVAKVIRGNDTV